MITVETPHHGGIMRGNERSSVRILDGSESEVYMKGLNINHFSVIVQIALVGITFWFSYSTLKISEDKFASENRPYLYIDKIEWLGNENELFKVNVINPSNFPATFFVEYTIKDRNQNIILENTSYNEDYNLNIFPYERERTITFGYNKIQLTDKDTGKKIFLIKRGLEEVLELYNSGQELVLNLTIIYKGLSADLNDAFSYSQIIEIQRLDNTPRIEVKKFIAD